MLVFNLATRISLQNIQPEYNLDLKKQENGGPSDNVFVKELFSQQPHVRGHISGITMVIRDFVYKLLPWQHPCNNFLF